MGLISSSSSSSSSDDENDEEKGEISGSPPLSTSPDATTNPTHRTAGIVLPYFGQDCHHQRTSKKLQQQQQQQAQQHDSFSSLNNTKSSHTMTSSSSVSVNANTEPFILSDTEDRTSSTHFHDDAPIVVSTNKSRRQKSSRTRKNRGSNTGSSPYQGVLSSTDFYELDDLYNLSDDEDDETDNNDDDEEDDDIILTRQEQYSAMNFCMEHRIFLKAALNLLSDRDKQAPELGMMDPVIIKAGPLKKAAHLMNGVWKVKYVEIRRGMFSYYENAVSRTDPNNKAKELLRKNIPLEASSCTCRPVKLHQKAFNFTPLGAIFEVSVNGSKRLWMANTREERHTWMHAIHYAMVGGSVTRGDSSLYDNNNHRRRPSPKSPFGNDLRTYLKTQNVVRQAKNSNEYLLGLRELLNHSLQVPVKWIAKRTMSQDGDNSNFREETIDLSIDQLWRDLQRDTVSIDGVVQRGDTGHGPERIVGHLMRRILDVSRSADTAVRPLSESQALACARDALLAGNRTRTGGDSYFCINTLCKNDPLVVIVPSSREVDPVAFEVAEDQSEHSFHSRLDGKSGWIKTRNLLNRTWKRRYFVLSEGTLSYYEGAQPRPYGLRGQLFLKDAALSLKKRGANQFVLSITVSEGTTTLRETLLLFESPGPLVDWIYALECTIKSKSLSESSNPKKTKLNRRSSSAKNVTKPENVVPEQSNFVDILTIAQASTLEYAASLGMEGEFVVKRLERMSRRTSSAVRISLRACTEYKICTTDPQGVDDLDTWAVIRTHFLQTLRVTGGPNGRISRGEETVRISVVDCLELPDSEIPEPPKSPNRRKSRMIFRNASAESEDPDLPIPT